MCCFLSFLFFSFLFVRAASIISFEEEFFLFIIHSSFSVSSYIYAYTQPRGHLLGARLHFFARSLRNVLCCMMGGEREQYIYI